MKISIGFGFIAAGGEQQMQDKSSTGEN